MSKKKRTSQAVQQQRKAAPAAKSKLPLIIGAIAVAVIAGIAWANGGGAKSGGASTSAATSSAISAEEQKYMGRFLPTGYKEPAVQPVTYSGVTKMTNVTAVTSDTAISVAVDELIANKIVSFDYAKGDGQTIPMVAYIKPSGKVFVGVSLCVPCKGRGQLVDTDGTLTCESCGTKRDLETMAGLSGACKLYPLDEIAATIAGGKLIVEKSALEKWTPQPLDRKVG